MNDLTAMFLRFLLSAILAGSLMILGGVPIVPGAIVTLLIAVIVTFKGDDFFARLFSYLKIVARG